ncbi:hypothetical protein, partial [Curtobacterium aurantiacum]|uniref:hypothetical protein n=1 Tax=Curtobacterium aurantiacum TaxID=3236919 RepID=UPI001BDF5100
MEVLWTVLSGRVWFWVPEVGSGPAVWRAGESAGSEAAAAGEAAARAEAMRIDIEGDVAAARS